MRFEYKILTSEGKIDKGEIEAVDERNALQLLSEEGPQNILSIKEVGEIKVSGSLRKIDFANFFSELATLLAAGVPIASAVESLAENADRKISSKTWWSLVSLLKQGRDLSSALEGIDSRSIPSYMFQLIRAGEASGALSEALENGARQMHAELDSLDEAKSALVYPAILIFVGIISVGLVFTTVVPNFVDMLNQSNDLPLISVFVLQTGLFFNSHSSAILLSFSTCIALVLFSLRSERSRNNFLNFLGTWPLAGQWLRESDESRWTSVLGALLSSGVSLVLALRIANSGLKIKSIQEQFEQVEVQVRGGSALSEALRRSSLLWPVAFSMLDVGEKSGELPKMLTSIASLYEKKRAERLKRMLTLIEPVAILIIGAIIGTIILGIVLAITSVSEIPI